MHEHDVSSNGDSEILSRRQTVSREPVSANITKKPRICPEAILGTPDLPYLRHSRI